MNSRSLLRLNASSVRRLRARLSCRWAGAGAHSENQLLIEKCFAPGCCTVEEQRSGLTSTTEGEGTMRDWMARLADDVLYLRLHHLGAERHRGRVSLQLRSLQIRLRGPARQPRSDDLHALAVWRAAEPVTLWVVG